MPSLRVERDVGVVARLVDPMKMSSLMQDKTDTELNSDDSFANIGHLQRHWANFEQQPSELPAEESSYDLVD